MFDDVVEGAPRFDFTIICQAIDRLMMRAVYFLETMCRFAIITQWLNVMVAHLREFVPRNVELECPTKGDVEKLKAFANGKDR